MYFVTLRLVQYSYHSHIGEVIWCWIFWWFYWSFSSLLNHSSYFFGRTWPPFYNSKCFPCILGMLGTDHPYTCYLFPVGWSPYSFGYSNTCRNWHFPVLDDITKYPNLVTPGCLLLSPTFWKPNGFVLSPIINFFTELPTQEKLSPTPNKHSFKYHVNMFPLMCESKSKCLVINSSYHMCILFIFSPFLFNTTYLSWLTTSYGCPSFRMSVWSYHWQFKYPFALVPLWEWTYNSPWYISRYSCSYYLGEWSTCSERGLPPFPSPHLTTSGYPYL